MPFSIVQAQGGHLALSDEAGNIIGVFTDSEDNLRLMVQTMLAAGHGLATEATLAAIKDTDGIAKITAPVSIAADSPKVLDNAMALEGILKELQRIRVLLEHLTDEKVHEHDLETRV